MAVAAVALLAPWAGVAQTAPPEGAGAIIRLDPRFDALVPANAAIEKVADGFVFLEGPVWRNSDSRLFYSDLRGNAVYQWTAAEGVRDVAKPFFTGDGTGLRGVGPNGIALDAEGRLLACVYGSRSIIRIEKDGSRTTLADRFEGKRLNSPNDLVVGRDGTVYFTDPSFGLEGMDNSPLRELSFNGVYRLRPNGQLELLTREQERPNGLALSPDESILYVANSGGAVTGWMAYDLGPAGLSNKRVFFDVTGVEGAGGADGMKVDLAGNVYATGPGGVWVIAPDGTHLGTIRPDEALTNVGWGDDGRTLYITGRTALYRIRTSARGFE
jgi:gluconolactonase